MRSTPFRVTLPTCAVIVIAATWQSRAGDLNPPPGPITPTMKPLTDVEPRIAINATNTPGNSGTVFSINQPGSYYLTGNVIGESGKTGIQIRGFGGVSIDLMGFELAGVPGSLDGINFISETDRNLVIRNGIVRNWGGDGIDASSANSLLSDLLVSFNSGNGISGGDGSVSDCTALFNGGDGFKIGAGSFLNCVAISNRARGIVTTVSNVGSTVTGCTASFNGSFGIATSGTCTVTACTADNNQGNGGISVSSDSMLTGCTAGGNLGIGITAGQGSTVTGCTVNSNSTDGIFAQGPRCRVTDNLVSNNGSAGIYTSSNDSRIEGNTVSANAFGIYLFGSVSGNMVIRNHATGNASGNYINPASGNFIGTIITTSGGMNSATNSLVNISF